MPERPLLLSSAKSAVLISPSPRSSLVRIAATVIGVIMVAVGAIDLSGRLAPFFKSDAGILAFGPAIVALEPGALDALRPASSTVTFIPTHLAIPSLHIEARVEQVGVKENGSMQNPSSFTTTGWYKYGARAGEAGSTVIAGHVNNGIGLSGVFASLSAIAIGEQVTVSGEAGTFLKYIVVSKTQYTTADAPLAEIFKITGPSELVLVTCEGDWDPESRSYDRRLVVVARLLE